MDVADFTYHVLPGRPTGPFEKGTLHALAYAFWRTFWLQVMKDNGTEHRMNPDDFFRQDRVTLLMSGDEIAAMHTYTFFSLDSPAIREHSYFQRYYGPDFFEHLEKKGVRSVMTMEHLSVDPRFRGRRAGVSLANLVVCLGLKHLTDSGAGACITVARSDNGVTKLACNLGAVPVGEEKNFYNTPCQILAWYPDAIQIPADIPLRRALESLWTDRRTVEQPVMKPARKAA